MALDTNERQDLIKLLISIPVLSQFQGREAVMATAGLQTLLPQLNLEGPAFVALSNLVNSLEAFGRTTNGYVALGQFLNTLKEMGLVGLEGQRFLDNLLTKHALMIPIVGTQPIDEWHGSDGVEKAYEKIIGENTLRPIAFLQLAIEAAKSVCFLNVGGKRAGTGFMISSDLLLTCWHVLLSESDAQETIFRFNYQASPNGGMAAIADYQMTRDGIFFAKKDLDYTIVQLNGHPGKEWGHLCLKNSSIEVGSRVNIIQHPAAQPKQISIQNNFIEYAGGGVIQYVTSTLPGSSGSPVFDDSWRVIGLHHAGGMLPEPTTQRRYFRNEGIRSTSILGDVPEHIKKQIESED